MAISVEELLNAGGGAQHFIDSINANKNSENINWCIIDQSIGLNQDYIDYMIETVDRLDGLIDLDFTLVKEISESSIIVTLNDYDGQGYAGLASVYINDNTYHTELEVVDYSTSGNTSYNQNTFAHEWGHNLGLGEPGYDIRWDQDDTAMSYNIGDIGWQTWYTDSDLNAFYSVWGKENDNNEQEANIIESITGKGKLRGTEDKDQFTFNQFELFNRENADKIIGFNASHGDTIGVSMTAFPSLQGYETISFASTNTKEDFRTLKNGDYNFIYFEGSRNGRLFFNGNGTSKGWGNEDQGGIIAILKGAPALSAENLTLLG